MSIQEQREAEPAGSSAQLELTDQLSRLLKSPDRVKALVLFVERTINPKELARELGITMSSATHHVNELRKMGLIELVAEEPRRGAVAHLYRAVLRPIWSDEDWSRLSVKERQEYATWGIQLAMCDVAEALFAGTFNDRVDTHTSCTPLRLDEQGRQELHAVHDETLRRSLKIEEACSKRLAESGEEGLRVSSTIFCVDLPASSSSRGRERLKR